MAKIQLKDEKSTYRSKWDAKYGYERQHCYFSSLDSVGNIIVGGVGKQTVHPSLLKGLIF